jgi:hypothetical protein
MRLHSERQEHHDGVGAQQVHAQSIGRKDCERSQFHCEGRLMDVAGQLRELSEPKERGEKIPSIITRTARLAGLSYSRCYEIWYRRARKIGPEEIVRISEALERKNAKDARNELSELRLRLTRLESLLVQTDPDFHRQTVDLVRSQARRSG